MTEHRPQPGLQRGEVGWGEGEGGKGGNGLGGRLRADPAPPEPPLLRPSAGATPHPAPAVRAATAAAPHAGPGLPCRVRSVCSRCSDSSSRRRCRHGPGAGALRHFRLPLHSSPPPPGETSPATRGAGGTRRGKPGSPALPTRPLTARSWLPWSLAPRGDRALRPPPSTVAQPTLASSLPVAPTRGLRSGGGAWDCSDPGKGRGDCKRATSPTPRLLAALGNDSPSPHTTSP